MQDDAAPNAEQQRFWDQLAGPTWVRLGDAMDRMLAPVLEALLEVADLQKGARVLDIGCGAGASTLAAARIVGADGHVIGADISETLLHQAREKAAEAGVSNVAFRHCDAETHAFQPASFDALISRFGVMFFGDPAAAFANMATGLRPGARMSFATWGQIPNNPYFKLPATVARRYFGAAPPRSDPDGPGPFAFRDPDRVLGILKEAGLTDARVDVRRILLTPPDGAAGLAALCAEIGPTEIAFEHFEASQTDRERVNAAVAEAFSVYETDGVLRVPSEINIVKATVP